MKTNRPIGYLFLALTVALTVGCAQMDRKAIRDVLQPPLRGEAELPIEIPDISPDPAAAEDHFALAPDGSGELSIEQAVMMAIRNNRDLKVRQMGPVIAGTFEQIERGQFDPELFAETQYSEERLRQTARSTGTQFNVEGSDTLTTAGIRQELATGTSLEASVEHSRSTSDRTPEQQTAVVGLSITQSLLRGFGPAVNLAAVRQARLDGLSSRYELRGFTEALVAETEIAYWNYLLARKQIEIVDQSLAVARQQRDEVQLRIEVGILPAVEAAAARAEVSRREQALIEAKSLLEENALRLLQRIDPALTLRADARPNPVSEPGTQPEPIADLADRLELAEKSRPDLKEAMLRLAQDRLETVVTRNGLLPKLDLFMALRQIGFSDNLPDAFREIDSNTYQVTAGLRLSHFVRNRAAEARDLAARASRRQAAEAVANLKDLIRLDVRLAANELERVRQQISATRTTRILQEETLKAEQERFDVGSSTALTVAQAQRDLVAAQIAEVKAVVQYRIALVNLYLAEGSLLQRRGITVEM